MKKYILFFACSVVLLQGKAQTLSPSVVSAGGGFGITTAGSLSCTIGETAFPTLTGSTGKISQGFQQPELNIRLITGSDPICNGDTISITREVSGFISNANSFEIQLSDAYGSFAVPITLGTINGTSSGIVQTVIPFDILPGNNYKIKLKSTLPTRNSNSSYDIPISICAVRIDLLAFIEGFYIGGGQMINTLYLNGLSTDNTATDNITVTLHDAFAPFAPVESISTILHSDGTATCYFPGSNYNNSYYVAIQHRNSIETWSKVPVNFNSAVEVVAFGN